MKELWTIQRSLTRDASGLVCGVDEAGRGPLAGPVCAAAVILPDGLELPGLDDSKKLTEKRREELFPLICARAVSYSVAFADVEEIASKNILGATFLAMNRAIDALNPSPALALVDGNNISGIHSRALCVVGGDGLCASIAAASVLAKVTRDRYMVQLARDYPPYGFERHKGYPTKDHYDALRRFGPCPAHRLSFLKKMH